ncbi:aroma-sacti cluster domain-containing protein [Actinoplanes sp. NPDC049118]|uniref:aroma-sacti cluster domain-containing protein n=1 Tax=Actinoplanes sp. NPDC049118 TaxID=3155769 RepID=UPI00340FDC13
MNRHRYSLADLEANGIPTHALTAEQLEVLRDLTDDEFTLLVDIRSRLEAVGPDVQAHSDIAGAALF